MHTGLARYFPEKDGDGRMCLLSKLLSRRPAELFGLSGQKGRLRVGLDADIVVFDADASWSMTAADVYAKCGWSAYERSAMVGRPLVTIRRGEVIWDAASRRFGRPAGRWLCAERPADLLDAGDHAAASRLSEEVASCR